MNRIAIRPGLARDLPPPRWLTDEAGRRLAFNTYPAPDPWLHVLISHGFAEHRGWWQHVALGLNEAGITAHLFDHFHHGLSDGPPADLASYDELVGGLCLALRQGVSPLRRPGLPLAVLGHSNGGLAALMALRQLAPGSVDALVLSSPLLGLPGLKMATGALLARLLNGIVPAWRLPLARHPERLTANPEVWGEFDGDPYRFREISVRFYRAMVAAARRAYREADCQGLPLLVLCASDEQVVDPRAMLRWFSRVNSPDKRRILYPGLRHELFNETAWRTVLDDVVEWLRERLAPPAPLVGN